MRPVTPSRKPFRLVFIAGLVLLVGWLAFRSARAEGAKPADASPMSGSSPAPAAAWQMKMHEISRFLGELAPFLYDETKFKDPANKTKIESLTEKLAGLAHDIDQKKMRGKGLAAPDLDPALQVISAEFDETVTRAHQGFKEGHFDYARSLLKTSVSHCISCHTRAATPGAKPVAGFNSGLAGAGAAERVRFYAATRQFDLVAQEFETTFSSKPDSRVVDLESAARVALSVAIRVRKDIGEAARIATRVSTHPAAPDSLKEEAKVWLKELALWKAETPTAPASSSATLAAARELVIRGQLMQQSPSDARGDVAYLKASSLLHDMLKKKVTKEEAADAYYYIGVCYEALRDLGFWSLHESYYEACIRTKPASPRAEGCYSRLADSVRLGYTGTRGTDIPSSVQRKLSALEKMAKAPAAKPRPRP